MRPLLLIAPLTLALLAGCKGSQPAATPTPTAPLHTPNLVAPTPVIKVPAAWQADIAGLPAHVVKPLGFIEQTLSDPKILATMQQVTCHCCNKTLAQCYQDTATRAAKACSPL